VESVKGIPLEQVKVYALRLVRKGLVKKLLRGYISLTEDPFIISCQLVEPSYISFTSALYVRGLLKQAPSIVECVTPLNSRMIKKLSISYHKIDGRLFFGYERVARYGSYIMVAHPEKALLDMVYFGRLVKGLKIKVEPYKLHSIASRYRSLANKRARRVLRWVKEYALSG